MNGLAVWGHTSTLPPSITALVVKCDSVHRVNFLFPKSCVCVCVWVGGWVGGCASACQCMWASVCVCCSHLFSFFPLAFVMVNDLSLVSRFLFWKCVRFCFRFCCRLFLFVVRHLYFMLLPCHTRCSFTDVLSCTPTGVSEINHLTWSYPSKVILVQICLSAVFTIYFLVLSKLLSPPPPPTEKNRSRYLDIHYTCSIVFVPFEELTWIVQRSGPHGGRFRNVHHY